MSKRASRETREQRAILSHAVEEVARLLRTDGGIMYLVEPAGGRLRFARAGGVNAPRLRSRMRSLTLGPGDGLIGRAVATRRPQLTSDYLTDLRFTHTPRADALARNAGVRSMVVAPLVSGDEAIGALGTYSSEADRFSESDVTLVRALADHAAAAIANARLIAQLAHSRDELARRADAERTLREISAGITAIREPAELLQYAVDEAARLLRADGAIIDLLNPATGRLIWAYDAGIDDAPERDWLRSIELTLGEGVFGRAVSEARTYNTGDYLADERFPRGPDPARFAEGFGIRSSMAAPMIGESGPFGALGVWARRANAWDVADEATIRALADQAAVASTSARLIARLAESEARYRYLSDSSPDTVWQADAEGRFTYLSDRAFELTGWRPDELIGRSFAELIAPADLPMVLSYWGEAQARPEVSQHYRFSAVRRDGSHVPVEMHGRAIIRDGEFAGAHGSVRDVSVQVGLERDLRQHTADLAAAEERGHLARELHDSVTQALFGMTLLTRSIEMLLREDPDAAMERLASLRDLQRDALAEMRSLIFELRPGSLAEEGLVRALRTHAAAVQGRIGLPIVLAGDQIERLPIEVEDALYRIAQEALHNVVKHASARQVRLELRRESAAVRLVVEDDGVGFDSTTPRDGHFGLAGMRARAERINGQFAVTSRHGAGTRIDVLVPAGQMT